MIATIRAFLGPAGLVDVGYQFFTQNTPAGSRVTTGIVDEGQGWYSASSVTLAGDQVRWDSTGTPNASAREDLWERFMLQAIVDNASSSAMINILAIVTQINSMLQSKQSPRGGICEETVVADEFQNGDIVRNSLITERTPR
jgi:hypothetical protein